MNDVGVEPEPDGAPKAQLGDIELVAKPPPETGLLDAIRRSCGEPLH